MLATRVGSLVLHIPKFRDGTLRADLFSSYQRSEQALLLSLKERGLEEVDLVTSDDHGGLTKAIRKHFCGASWQHCQTHFSKNLLDRTPKKLQPDLKVALTDLENAPDLSVLAEHCQCFADVCLKRTTARATRTQNFDSHDFS